VTVVVGVKPLGVSNPKKQSQGVFGPWFLISSVPLTWRWPSQSAKSCF